MTIAVVVHNHHDGYSILRAQLSYTGNRHDFYHEKYDRHFKRAYNPLWFNLAYILGGLSFAIGFIQIEDFWIKLLGLLFSCCVVIIGIYDVGTNYRFHSFAIVGTQVFFYLILIRLLSSYFSNFLLAYTLLLLFFVCWYVYTKVANTRNYNPNRITVSQRIGVFLEIIFLAILPSLII